MKKHIVGSIIFHAFMSGWGISSLINKIQFGIGDEYISVPLYGLFVLGVNLIFISLLIKFRHELNLIVNESTK